MGGAADPMIHRLSTWMILITALEAVEGQLIGSVSAGMAVGRCGRPYPSRVMNRLRSGTLRIALE
jgi:hypothetical protein